MAKKDPFTFQRLRRTFPTFKAIMEKEEHIPHIGVTQGGSSRPNAGSKPAATNGLARRHRQKPTSY